MVVGLFDTNILIDYLNAVPQARKEIERFENGAVSNITWMDVMVGANTDMVEPTRRFLEGFNVIPLDDESLAVRWHCAERTASSCPTR